MNEQPKGRMLSKQNLDIINVELDVPYSQGTKALDRVQAVNLSLAEDNPLAGKPLRMTIFNQDLKTFIRGKTKIVADIEERVRPDSEYGPDRTIVQVYDEDKPVSVKKGGGGNWRRSLEDDLALEGVKRRSIEGQTAISQVGLVLTCPTPIPGEHLGIDEATWNRIVAKYWRAIEQGLDNYLVGAKPKAAPMIGPTNGNPSSKGQDEQGKAPKTAGVSKDKAPPFDPIKHVGDLLTRASKRGLNPAQVATILKVEKVAEITDLNGVWKKIEEYLAAEKKPSVK